MTFGGLPLLLATRTLQDFTADTRTRLDDARFEATTGLIADLREATNGDVGRISKLEKLRVDNLRYSTSLNLASTRFETVQLVLSEVSAGASNLATSTEAALGRGDPVSLEALATDAETQLETILTALNSSLAGRQLFSGAAIDTPPMQDATTLLADLSALITPAPDAATATAALDAYFAVGGTFETTFYQGDQVNAEPSIEIAPGRRVAPGVTAIDPAIKDILRGVAVIALTAGGAATNPIYDELAADAAGALRAGEAGAIALQADLGGVQEQIATLQSRNAFFQTSLDNTYLEEASRDQFEAAADMTALETQLEAVYLTTARIASLNLTSFLR